MKEHPQCEQCHSNTNSCHAQKLHYQQPTRSYDWRVGTTTLQNKHASIGEANPRYRAFHVLVYLPTPFVWCPHVQSFDYNDCLLQKGSCLPYCWFTFPRCCEDVPLEQNDDILNKYQGNKIGRKHSDLTGLWNMKRLVSRTGPRKREEKGTLVMKTSLSIVKQAVILHKCVMFCLNATPDS